jgi:CheY-like chemotaxis protein
MFAGYIACCIDTTDEKRAQENSAQTRSGSPIEEELKRIQRATARGAGESADVFVSPVVEERRDLTSVAVDQPAASNDIILIVEDEPLLRFAVSKGLRKKGFTVLEAGDGTEAIDLIATASDIDVILLDCVLPGTPSPKVFEYAQRARPEVRVILTSAHARETAEAAFAGLKFERFIRKPYRIAELAQLLQAPA